MTTASLHVSLPETLKDYVTERVREGAFSNPSDYVRALIRADRELQARRTALVRDLDVGIDDVEQGRVVDGAPMFDELRTRFDDRT